MKIVTISDTHNKHNDIELPEGDVLVVAGDFTGIGSLYQLEAFTDWLKTLDFKHYVIVAGNHELGLEKHWVRYEFFDTLDPNMHYLEDSSVTLDGVVFYGAPWQPEFNQWAFNVPRGKHLKAKWANIRGDTDVLVTHGPPASILDSNAAEDDPRKGFGCDDLLDKVLEVKPKYHIFGHIHGGYGQMTLNGTTFVNTAILDEDYQVANKPWVLEI